MPSTTISNSPTEGVRKERIARRSGYKLWKQTGGDPSSSVGRVTYYLKMKFTERYD